MDADRSIPAGCDVARGLESCHWKHGQSRYKGQANEDLRNSLAWVFRTRRSHDISRLKSEQ